ncbi:putative Calmodulin-binding family protein [Monocercomonoides exilis]|uniref:putative Calmodulin-binding family protein n=1 Tax=Monocercomonoides exilis TaxID=2049356 RepID=UPI0035596993|nr:putative Calmodulin-binding family protein [Monocercomonoides exilis]|eukprot:MONOS_716.1-p1 / transcript=MONOS_716.1 / gene=MONOS_716 / organism=Monocercomonoides_exilis_PA203 / gene_product=Calmodulin-binding family protein / transcript_product=Calmodulin-binding family protein / location=Mono_scaffold00012:57814-63472(-) / protein_length=1706 / sequence_SO=supercontig / SO=protein_coding / is_pseudo=false
MLLFLILSSHLIYSLNVPINLRGVYPDDYKLYNGTTFTCKDKSKTIPISSVNDEICDCPDGSDEPGTSACHNSRFWCLNSGGRGFFLPSFKVNDGICDCCDGSDEMDENGETNCINTCRESSANPYIFLDRQKKAMAKGKELRKAEIEAAKYIREDLKNETIDLQKDVSELDSNLKEMEEKETDWLDVKNEVVFEVKDDHRRRQQEVKMMVAKQHMIPLFSAEEWGMERIFRDWLEKDKVGTLRNNSAGDNGMSSFFGFDASSLKTAKPVSKQEMKMQESNEESLYAADYGRDPFLSLIQIVNQTAVQILKDEKQATQAPPAAIRTSPFSFPSSSSMSSSSSPSHSSGYTSQSYSPSSSSSSSSSGDTSISPTLPRPHPPLLTQMSGKNHTSADCRFEVGGDVEGTLGFEWIEGERIGRRFEDAFITAVSEWERHWGEDEEEEEEEEEDFEEEEDKMKKEGEEVEVEEVEMEQTESGWKKTEKGKEKAKEKKKEKKNKKNKKKLTMADKDDRWEDERKERVHRFIRREQRRSKYIRFLSKKTEAHLPQLKRKEEEEMEAAKKKERLEEKKKKMEGIESGADEDEEDKKEEEEEEEEEDANNESEGDFDSENNKTGTASLSSYGAEFDLLLQHTILHPPSTDTSTTQLFVPFYKRFYVADILPGFDAQRVWREVRVQMILDGAHGGSMAVVEEAAKAAEGLAGLGENGTEQLAGYWKDGKWIDTGGSGWRPVGVQDGVNLNSALDGEGEGSKEYEHRWSGMKDLSASSRYQETQAAQEMAAQRDLRVRKPSKKRYFDNKGGSADPRISAPLPASPVFFEPRNEVVRNYRDVERKLRETAKKILLESNETKKAQLEKKLEQLKRKEMEGRALIAIEKERIFGKEPSGDGKDGEGDPEHMHHHPGKGGDDEENKLTYPLAQPEEEKPWMKEKPPEHLKKLGARDMNTMKENYEQRKLQRQREKEEREGKIERVPLDKLDREDEQPEWDMTMAHRNLTGRYVPLKRPETDKERLLLMYETHPLLMEGKKKNGKTKRIDYNLLLPPAEDDGSGKNEDKKSLAERERIINTQALQEYAARDVEIELFERMERRVGRKYVPLWSSPYNQQIRLTEEEKVQKYKRLAQIAGILAMDYGPDSCFLPIRDDVFEAKEKDGVFEFDSLRKIVKKGKANEWWRYRFASAATNEGWGGRKKGGRGEKKDILTQARRAMRKHEFSKSGLKRREISEWDDEVLGDQGQWMDDYMGIELRTPIEYEETRQQRREREERERRARDEAEREEREKREKEKREKEEREQRARAARITRMKEVAMGIKKDDWKKTKGARMDSNIDSSATADWMNGTEFNASEWNITGIIKNGSIPQQDGDNVSQTEANDESQNKEEQQPQNSTTTSSNENTFENETTDSSPGDYDFYKVVTVHFVCGLYPQLFRIRERSEDEWEAIFETPCMCEDGHMKRMEEQKVERDLIDEEEKRIAEEIEYALEEEWRKASEAEQEEKESRMTKLEKEEEEERQRELERLKREREMKKEQERMIRASEKAAAKQRKKEAAQAKKEKERLEKERQKQKEKDAAEGKTTADDGPSQVEREKRIRQLEFEAMERERARERRKYMGDLPEHERWNADGSEKAPKTSKELIKSEIERRFPELSGAEKERRRKEKEREEEEKRKRGWDPEGEEEMKAKKAKREAKLKRLEEMKAKAQKETEKADEKNEL